VVIKYKYVRVCVCMRVHVYVRVCVYVYVCMHMCVFVHVHSVFNLQFLNSTIMQLKTFRNRVEERYTHRFQEPYYPSPQFDPSAYSTKSSPITSKL